LFINAKKLLGILTKKKFGLSRQFLNYVIVRPYIIKSETVTVIAIEQSIHESNQYWTDHESSQQ